MGKRLLLTAICLLVLPVFYSSSGERGRKDVAPFQSVAFAGHTLLGGWCECGAPGCMCDPGENPIGGQSAKPVSDRNGRSLNQGNPSASAGRTFGLDLGSGSLMLALAFLVWTRTRA